MKCKWLLLFAFFFPGFASADTPGTVGFKAVRSCVMQNDVNYCRSIMTPESTVLFDRFVSYKLMPCLPTDFIYVSEQSDGPYTTVKAVTPASNGTHYILRLVFVQTPAGLKLDIPASFKRGLGEKWQEKIQLSEQLYLMMRQNMGNKLTCDTLNDLIKPH